MQVSILFYMLLKELLCSKRLEGWCSSAGRVCLDVANSKGPQAGRTWGRHPHLFRHAVKGVHHSVVAVPTSQLFSCTLSHPCQQSLSSNHMTCQYHATALHCHHPIILYCCTAGITCLTAKNFKACQPSSMLSQGQCLTVSFPAATTQLSGVLLEGIERV